MLVRDSLFYVSAYLTPEAKAEFFRKFSKISIEELENKMILITKWDLSIHMIGKDETRETTSHAGYEVHLNVHSFEPLLSKNYKPSSFATNLYRDVEF